MNKKITLILVTVLGLFLFAVFVTKIQKRKFQKETTVMGFELEEPDASIVSHKEVRQIKLDGTLPKALNFYNELLYIAIDSNLQILDLEGHRKQNVALNDSPTCLEVTDNGIFIGFSNYITMLSHEFKVLHTTQKLDSNTRFTSIGATLNFIFIADAGNRRILKFNTKGELMLEFEGVVSSTSEHGFIIPSPYFDLDINSEGELWVVNPGIHSVQNYSYSGDLIRFWKKESMKTDGFTGCCNPAQMSITPGGQFLTSEKGLVRMKLYASDGEFISLIAPETSFKNNTHAPEAFMTNDNIIVALDFDQKMIRIFNPR